MKKLSNLFPNLIAVYFLIVPSLKSTVYAQDQDPGESGSSNIDWSDFEWLQGYWVGDGFGGVSEELWSAPTAGSVVGLYKHYNQGKVVFYEIITISENDGKISLRLKHFNADITAWEEKQDFVEFPLVKTSENLLEFKGLSYELMSEDEMQVRLKMKRSGEIHTEVFNFKRKKS